MTCHSDRGECVGKKKNAGFRSEMPNGNSDIDFSNKQPDACLSLCMNIRVLLKNNTELARFIKQQCPHLVCLQETWLNESIESYEIAAYK